MLDQEKENIFCLYSTLHVKLSIRRGSAIFGNRVSTPLQSLGPSYYPNNHRVNFYYFPVVALLKGNNLPKITYRVLSRG